MAQTIRARYQAGRLEPLEPLCLPEGSEVLVTVDALIVPPAQDEGPTAATAGVFKDSAAWEQFERELQERRVSEETVESGA